jgi:hypothetical protein
MQKIASNGATAGLEFTEGNAGLAIPATVVSADWLNSVQREIVNILLLLVGMVPLTPLTDTYDQIATAIKEFFLRGGRLTPVAISIVNNQAAALDVALFPTFSKIVTRTTSFDYYIRRETSVENLAVAGRANIIFNPATSTWNVVTNETAASGVTLSVVVDPLDISGNTFKLQYTSDLISGASYASEMKISNITQIRI